WIAGNEETNAPVDLLPDGNDRTHQRQFRVLRPAILDNGDVETARLSQNQHDQKVIDVFLTADGREKFADAAARNSGRQLAVIWHDLVLSAPTIHTAIPGGKVEIAGAFTDAETQQLLDVLNHRARAILSPSTQQTP